MKGADGLSGILIVDKPAGWTSFDVIGKLRGVLHQRRLGHAGTLDPMATGVLPVFAGYATRACGMLPSEDKAYTADFRLGQISDTQDSTGTVLETRPFSGITADDITSVLPAGEIDQLPPMYSAVKVGGKKLYELARAGKEVARTPRRIMIYEMHLTAFDPSTGEGQLTVSCGKGTYVRTLVHDMGQALGCGAVMTGLRRTAACGFTEAQSHTLEAIIAAAEAGTADMLVTPLEAAFASLPALRLDPRETDLYRNGVKLPLAGLGDRAADAARYAVFGDPDGFLGTAVPDREEGVLRVERNLSAPRA